MVDEGQTTIAQQQEAFKTERKTWDTQQTQLRQQLEECNEQIAQLSVELEQTQTELKTQHSDSKANRTREDEAFTKQSIELPQRVAELESQCEQFSQEREEFERDRQELQRQLSDLREQHSALQTAAAAAGETSASPRVATADEPQTPIEKELRRRVEQSRDEQTESAPSEQESAVAETTVQPTSTQPSSTDEEALFARLRAMSVLKQDSSKTDEDEIAQTSETQELPVAAEEETGKTDQAEEATDQPAQDEVEPTIEEPPVVAASAPIPEQHHSDDDSIDDYMTKLLQRMRGMSADEPPPAQQPASTARASEPTPAADPSAGKNTEASPPDAVENPLKPSKFEPRSAAPERTHDLAAMREIANISARAAIATHHHRSGSNQAWTTVFVGGFCLALGILLLCLTPEFVSMITLCGLGGLGVGIYFMVQSRSLLRNLNLSKHHKQLQLEEIAREQHLKPHGAEQHVQEPLQSEQPEAKKPQS